MATNLPFLSLDHLLVFQAYSFVKVDESEQKHWRDRVANQDWPVNVMFTLRKIAEDSNVRLSDDQMGILRGLLFAPGVRRLDPWSLLASTSDQ